ncbi:response regulator transcription factor [Flavimobilis sp. GY10621]|uniref:Response regulator transcription factor n=1 Tax=Flavimobilis rhizosphaerae TaxID=2775421 RepID=A0ABR9DQB4_9MICO|nr:LuxR C-terminal-related transcriptional regulator [Flavimobilis rhizosphaerae]MBD9699333.1 response regulator transcription factor [Flavimobilis rhizosphaerae]
MQTTGTTEDRAPLTRRELVVLSHLSDDVTLDDVARELFVSRNTVKTQVRSVYRKLGISTRAEAVVHARRLGLRQDG